MSRVYDRWKSKARALARLAEDQRGKPEGDVARQKLLEIINKHPEARDYDPIKTLVQRDLTMKDVGFMHQHGISMEGSWEGESVFHAIYAMQEDYKRRIGRYFDGIGKQSGKQLESGK